MLTIMTGIMFEVFKISLITFMFCALGQEKGDIFHWYQRLLKRLPEFLSKPLGGCYMCFTGQVCFWVYLLNRISLETYDLFEHLFYVSAGIIIAMIYNKIYCYLK